MTPQELESTRQGLKVQARDIVLEWAGAVLGRLLGNAPVSLADARSRLTERAGQVTLPELGAAYSDLMAAEMKDALDEAWQVFEREALKSWQQREK